MYIVENIKEKEAQKILPHLKGRVAVMAIEGEKLSSEGLATLIKDYKDRTGITVPDSVML